MTFRANRFLLMLLMGVTAFGLTSCSTVRKGPNFTKRAAEIQTVTVIPTDIMITRVVFKGDNETLFKESEQAAKIAQQKIETEFAKRGYAVRPFNLKKDSALAVDLDKLKTKYTARLGDVQNNYVRKIKWKDFDMSLGADVNPFADLFDSDILVFASGAGFVRSGGEIAKSLAKTVLIAGASLGTVVYVENQSGGQIHLSVVDGDNGEILWHNFSNPNLAFNLTKDDHVEKMVDQAVKPFPKRTAYKDAAIEIAGAPEAPDDITAAETPEEADVSRRKINVPYETGKLAVKTGVAAGEAGYDITKEALKASKDVGTAVPRAAFNLITLGAYRHKTGDDQSAVKAYKEAVKLDRKNPWAYLALADAYREIGEFKDAKKQLEKAIKLDDGIAKAHEMLAEVLEKLGDEDEARRERELYESLVPAETALPAVGAPAAAM